MAEHIVAAFETEAEATAAAQSLQTVGIPLSAIRQYAGGTAVGQEIEPTEHTTTHRSGGGFWAWLFGEDSTSETTHSAYTHDAYDRRAAAGNVVLSVTVDEDAKIHQAIAALEAHHPVDIDERSDEPADAIGSGTSTMTARSTTGQEFSTGEVAQAGVSVNPPSGRADGPNGPAAFAAETTTWGSSATSRATPDTGLTGTGSKGEEVLPLAEEQLEVGKRTIDRGTTRIRRYVVEKPVEESITLRDEQVIVEKRAPLDSAVAPGARAFEERVVEVRETAEEPVVGKTARVVEEVVVGREATERTETVRDTVRREEVEIVKDSEVKR